MSKNFAKISSVREIVSFSEVNDIKKEIFQDVDFKNLGNYQKLQTHFSLDFPSLSQEKNPKKIEYFPKNNNDNNPGQTSSIRQEIYDSTLFLLPKISAHYAVKNLQELQQIDEINRKLLGIDDELNYENKENDQSVLVNVCKGLKDDSNKSIIENFFKKKDQTFDNPTTSVRITHNVNSAESLVRKSRIL